MKRRCLLHLDADGLSAWNWRRDRLQALAHFANDAGGHAAFADFLAARRDERLMLFADLADESLQPIEIPRLSRGDRNALLARRLARHFPDTPLRCALPAGRHAATPGSEQIQLLALAAPWRLTPWLARLTESGCELRRLHTASQLAGPLVKRLDPTAANALLIVCQSGRFRITGLASGYPRFSRQASAEAPATILGEAMRLERYLVEQRLHADGQPLPVFVIAPAAQLAELAEQWPAGGRLVLRATDPATAAARVGLAAPPEPVDARAILLQLLASAPPAQAISLGAAVGRARSSGRRLLAGAAAILVAALGFAAWQVNIARLARDEARHLDHERQRIEARRVGEHPLPPSLPVDAASLHRLSEARQAIARQQHQPGPAYQRLSQLLDRQPAIAIDRIDWKILPPTASTAAAAVEATTLYGRLRATPAAFAAFIASLRGDPEQELQIRQLPDDGEFVVELQRKLGP